jgi:hypothetical protein
VNRQALGAAFASIAFAAVTPVAIEAQGDVALSRVAAELGYHYSYLGPEDAVALSRPGVTILVRPGERLFDVNDRTEAMSGGVPHFYQSDVFVSPQLVARLRAIATLYPLPAPVRGSVVIPNTSSFSGQQITGSIVELMVRQLPGTQQVDVSGKAPVKNLPITLTLIGTFSSEIPDTVLSRRHVYTDDEGRFRTTVSIAPGYMRGAYLTLVASSVSGVASASLRFEVKAPNGDVSVPAEQPPRSLQ